MVVKPGQILMGKYRFERIIGRGGIGLVAKAHHLHLDESVAIKLLLPKAAKDEEVVKRFLREGQAAVKLKSEHVCRVLDVGLMDSGSPYMVMEYMAGIDLRRLLKKHGKIHPAAAVDFVLQACAALGEAHSLGIVHRDIKPANLFITTRTDGSDVLKVLDFGISKLDNTAQEDITHAHTLLGTPAYMSPEQMRTPKDVDGRTDIWALGVVLYELLSGDRPFRGEAFSELCLQVVSDPVPPLNIELPPYMNGLPDVIMRCLAKEVDDRFPNVAELSAALAPFAADHEQAFSLLQRTSRSLQVPVLPPELTTGSHISRNAGLTDSQKSRISGSHRSQPSHISQMSQSHISRLSHVSELSSDDLVSHDSHISGHRSQLSGFGTGSGSTLGEGFGQVVTPIKGKRRRVWWLAALLLLFMAGFGFVFLTGSPKTGAAEKSAIPKPPPTDPESDLDTQDDNVRPDDGSNANAATNASDGGVPAHGDDDDDDGTKVATGDGTDTDGDGTDGDDDDDGTDNDDGTAVTAANPDGDGDQGTSKKKKKKKRKKKNSDNGDDDDDFLDSRN